MAEENRYQLGFTPGYNGPDYQGIKGLVDRLVSELPVTEKEATELATNLLTFCADAGQDIESTVEATILDWRNKKIVRFLPEFTLEP